MDFDRYPRIPRRRAPLAGTLLNWATAIGTGLLIGWLAAQGF